ncbi:MAG: hypothetical protein RR806_09350, partial [Oscillospiraceae bacterium]
GKLHCDFIAPFTGRSTMIYHRSVGIGDTPQQAKATRCVPSCPACHFCSQTNSRILYSQIYFY